MNKTMKQLADELGIDKQKVYRFVKKNHIIEAHQKNGLMCFNEAAQTAIANHFSQINCINEAHQTTSSEAVSDVVINEVILLLKNELEIKNKQIDTLQSELAAERLHNHEKDKQLLETLATLAAGQTADKQKALAATVIEGQKILSDKSSQPADRTEPIRTGWISRLLRK